VSGPHNDVHWVNASDVVLIGKSHGYRMQLELKDWCQRMTYFLGRYYELYVLKLIDTVLRPGDRAIDIGGNIGMIALQMARSVGPKGAVECFEPNPSCVKRIEWHKNENRLAQIKIHPYGLGEKNDILELKLLGDHTGWSTFGHVEAADVRVIPVPVKIGDEVLSADPSPIRLIKIDVEGFELKVLRGLAKTLAQHKPVLIMELIEKQLLDANASSREIFELLGGLGYECYGLTLGGSMFSKRLELKKVSAQEWNGGFLDVAWIHPASKDTLAALRDANAIVS
jgi:FkbM family methyltransferase